MTPLVDKFLAWADGAVLKPLATSLNTAGLTSAQAFSAKHICVNASCSTPHPHPRWPSHFDLLALWLTR